MKFDEWLESDDLKEALDKDFKYKDVTKGLIGKWQFETDNGEEYTVTSSKISEDVYNVMFAYKKGSIETTALINIKKETTAILGTVLTIIEKEVIKAYHPKELMFEAESGRRQKMYDAVIRRYMLPMMKKYGYELMIEDKEGLPMKVYRFTKEE